MADNPLVHSMVSRLLRRLRGGAALPSAHLLPIASRKGVTEDRRVYL